jgi:hypothetical protein
MDINPADPYLVTGQGRVVVVAGHVVEHCCSRGRGESGRQDIFCVVRRSRGCTVTPRLIGHFGNVLIRQTTRHTYLDDNYRHERWRTMSHNSASLKNGLILGTVLATYSLLIVIINCVPTQIITQSLVSQEKHCYRSQKKTHVSRY